MCIGGRAVPDSAVVFLALDQGPDCLLILGSEGADRSGAASSSLSGWRCRGCSAHGAGAPAAASAAVPSGVQGMCLTLLVFQLPLGKDL